MNKKLFDKIKKACKDNNPVLFKEFDNGIITEESLSKAYDEIFNNRVDESNDKIDRQTIASACAVMCYKRSIKK